MKIWATIGLLLLAAGLLMAHNSKESSKECNDSKNSNESKCNTSGENGGGDDGNNGGEVIDTTTKKPPGGGSNRCSTKPEGTILPSYDCSMFVLCEKAQEVELECRPEGTMFDPKRVVCDYPENVQCWEGDQCSGKEDGAVVPSENCSNFIVCQGGRLGDEYTCVPDGTLFDHLRGVCDYPENVVCWGTSGPNTCEGRPDGSLAPTLDCSRYAVCKGGKQDQEVDCLPAGTVFDHVREVCDMPANVECWAPGSGGGSGGGGGSNSTTALPPTRPPVTDDIPKDICKGVIIGIFPHPSKCTKFIVCAMGQPTVESCKEDQIFYPSVGVCGYGNTETCEEDEKWLKAYLMEQDERLFD